MVDGGYQRVWADPYVISALKSGNIEDGNVIIGKKIISHMDIFPVITIKDRQDSRFFADTAEEFTDCSIPGFFIGDIDGI